MNKHRKTPIKLNELKVWGGELLFEQLSLRANTTLNVTVILFSLFSLSVFRSPFFGRAFTLYSFFFSDPDHTLVHYLSVYLSICPISHLLWLSVNGGGWNYTVQRSSPHKCCQKNWCNAFNTVKAAFSSRYFCILIIFACTWSSSLSLDPPRGSPRSPKYLLDWYSLYPRSIGSSNYIPSIFLYLVLCSENLLLIYSSLDVSMSQNTNLGSYPHNYNNNNKILIFKWRIIFLIMWLLIIFIN